QVGDGTDQIGEAVTVDPLGHVFLVAQVNGTVNFGGGAQTATIKNTLAAAKLDPSGNPIWAKLFHVGTFIIFGVTASPNFLNGVTLDANGNVVFTGSVYDGTDFGGGAISQGYGTNLVVAKLDTNGNHVWTRAFPGAAGQAIAVGGSYGSI